MFAAAIASAQPSRCIPQHLPTPQSLGRGRLVVIGAGKASAAMARAWGKGIKPQDSLSNNDGHGYFQALGDAVITGPTCTHVNDFRAILIDAPSREWTEDAQ